MKTLTHIPVHLGGVVVSQRTGENHDPYPGTPGGSGGQRTGENHDPYPGTPGGSGGQSEDW